MNNSSSSGVFIVFEKKLLLFHRDDIPDISYPDTWDLIGGMHEPGESAEEALKREIEEEVSYVPRNVIYLGKWHWDEGGTDEHIFWSQVERDEVDKFVKGEGEGQEIAWWSWKDINMLDLHGSFKILLKKGEVFFKKFQLGKQVATAEDLGLN